MSVLGSATLVSTTPGYNPRSEPYLQPELGWTHQRVTNLPRYFYGYQWRHMGFEEFLTSGAHPGKRKPARLWRGAIPNTAGKSYALMSTEAIRGWFPVTQRWAESRGH